MALPVEVKEGVYRIGISGQMADFEDVLLYLNTNNMYWRTKPRAKVVGSGKTLEVSGTIEQLDGLEDVIWDIRHEKYDAANRASRKIRKYLGMIRGGRVKKLGNRYGEKHRERQKKRRARKKKAKKELRDKQFGISSGKRDFIVSKPCDACGAPPPSDPSHAAKTRGAGGTAEHMVPHCRECHRELGRIGVKTFEKRHGQDMKKRAKFYEDQFQKHGSTQRI